MINGVRQFKLINGNGAEYDMTRPEALFHAPDGLGWGTEATVNRLGLTYVAIDEREVRQSPSGEMVFRGYEEYNRFLAFCQVGNLVLAYKPLNTWYYVRCLISINKSEIKVDTLHLVCPVSFSLTSYWYERIVTQTSGGDEPETPTYQTVSGQTVTFTAGYPWYYQDLQVNIQGSQELNGYSKPWVGGAGENLLPPPAENEDYIAQNNITYSARTDGTYHLSGTSTGGYTKNFVLKDSVTIENGMYLHCGNDAGMASVAIDIKNGTTSLFNRALSPVNRIVDLSEYAGQSFDTVAFYVANGQTLDNTIKPMLVKSSTATSYEPYENICPITSYTSVTVTQTGSQTNTYEVELTGAGNVYKGTLDVTTGELVVEWAVIESYNGETLPSEWISSGDEYVAGTTPTTGQTVAYELATPLTYQLTPTQINALVGSQTVSASTGSIRSLTYRTDAQPVSKTYSYRYSYQYGAGTSNVFTIDCDLPSYFTLTIMGEATNPVYRVLQNGVIVRSGKINVTVASTQKLVINTNPKEAEIRLYTKTNTRVRNVYGSSDFTTERMFSLPRGQSQMQVLSEDSTQPRVLLEVLKHV